MQFTCDRCQGGYDAKGHNATAHLFLKDSRCNHIEAFCSHYGNKEVIFLGPRQITTIIRDHGVSPTVEAEATPQLRVRAEKAWAAADDKDTVAEPETGAGAGPAGQSMHAGPSGSADVLQRYELTRRHEELLDAFGDTLSNI